MKDVRGSVLKRSQKRLLARWARASGYTLVAPSERQVLSLDRERDAIYGVGDVRFFVRSEVCFYPYGFGYARWHPFVATLRQYAHQGDLRYEDSILKRFYEAFQPRNMLELYFPPPHDDHRQGALARYSPREFLPVLPWDPEAQPVRGEKGLAAKHGHQGYGPVSLEKGRLEFKRLTAAYDAIVRSGYQPRGGDDIRGYFLLRGHEHRFLLRSGLHRAAALVAQGHDYLPVGFHGDHPRAIHVSDLPHWPLVRSGIFPEHLARRFIDQFFGEEDWYAQHVAPRVTERADPQHEVAEELKTPA